VSLLALTIRISMQANQTTQCSLHSIDCRICLPTSRWYLIRNRPQATTLLPFLCSHHLCTAGPGHGWTSPQLP